MISRSISEREGPGAHENIGDAASSYQWYIHRLLLRLLRYFLCAQTHDSY